ncbi:MAG: amino acid adenylation domain-containing protein [Bacteroidales bacterium]|nr:amino acid adenylation domain-containing protein [Bacteroidales bacterium]
MFYKEVSKPLLEAIDKHGSRNAFFINNEYYTYKQFAQRIVTIAKSLENIADTNIALITNDHLDTYASIFAIWFSGKAYVPLNPETPAERNQSIIDQVGIKTILNSDETRYLLSEDFQASLELLETYTLKSNFETQLAYIFYTSGSTGIPKGVMITKKNVASFVEAFWAMRRDINENDRCLQMFELTFDLSVMSYLIPLLKGACVYTIPKGQVKYSYISELMDEKELTIALMVPSILNYLRPYFSEIYCPQMRYSLFCGEALHSDVVEEWSHCVPNARIDNVYGPTEDTIFCTYYTYQRAIMNETHNGILSIGEPMMNNLAVVFNENNEKADNNETGELCLAGAQLTPGYFNNPLLNQEMFFTTNYEGVSTRFYRTGDLCLLRENGNINYIGRKDFQVKIQGFRVELSEVEYYAKKAIKEKTVLAALAIENSAGNYEIAIVFESMEFDITGVKEYMKSKIPSYMVPTQYFFIKPFPLNNNGKIDRKMLKGMILK